MDRVEVFLLGWLRYTLSDTMLDCGIVTRFVYHIERYAMIAGCLVIGYLPMEIDVMGQDKNLLYIGPAE